MIILHSGAIVVAALAAFLFGWLWYSPLMFQSAWMRLANIPNVKPSGKKMAWTMGLGLLSYIVLAGVMDVLFQMLGVGTLQIGLKIAALLWLGFVATLTVGMVTWEGKSWKLYVINNGYQLLAFLITAAVLLSVA